MAVMGASLGGVRLQAKLMADLGPTLGAIPDAANQLDPQAVHELVNNVPALLGRRPKPGSIPGGVGPDGEGLAHAPGQLGGPLDHRP